MICKIACNVIQVMNIAYINFFYTTLHEFKVDITKVQRIISRDRRIDL